MNLAMMKKYFGAAVLLSVAVSAGFNPAVARPKNECLSVMSGERPTREMLPDAQGRCQQGYVLYRTERTRPMCFGLNTLGLHNMPPTMDGRCTMGTQLMGGWCRDPRIPEKCSPPREPLGQR